MQRNLNFLDIPIPETLVWETLQTQQSMVAVEVLARLIVKATFANQNQEEDHDRSH